MELGLDISTWVDAVICDYNYVFDPNAHLTRFFGEGNKGDDLFLIEEAHNLVDRGREMYSARICKEDFLKIKRLVKTEDVKLGKRLEECNRQLLSLKRECGGCQVLDVYKRQDKDSAEQAGDPGVPGSAQICAGRTEYADDHRRYSGDGLSDYPGGPVPLSEI